MRNLITDIHFMVLYFLHNSLISTFSNVFWNYYHDVR